VLELWTPQSPAYDLLSVQPLPDWWEPATLNRVALAVPDIVLLPIALTPCEQDGIPGLLAICSCGELALAKVINEWPFSDQLGFVGMAQYLGAVRRPVPELVGLTPAWERGQNWHTDFLNHQSSTDARAPA